MFQLKIQAGNDAPAKDSLISITDSHKQFIQDKQFDATNDTTNKRRSVLRAAYIRVLIRSHDTETGK